MLKIDKPLLLPLQPPYPLITCFGYIEAQMASLLVQDRDGEIVSFPIVNNGYNIDGQIYTEDINDDFYPLEEYFKLGCNMGDEINWQKFIAIARLLFHHKTDLDLREIWYNLTEYNVVVEDRPEHFYVLVKDINPDDSTVDFTFCNEMAFKWDTLKMSYTSLISQVVDHLLLSPDANVHFLHQRPNDSDFVNNIEKLKKDVRNSFLNRRSEKMLKLEEHLNPDNNLMWASDLITIAKYVQNCLPEGCRCKNDVLLEIKKYMMLYDEKGDYNDQFDDYIWNFIVTNNLLPENEITNMPDINTDFLK